MSNKYSEGLDQRYIDRFGKGDEFGKEDRARYDAYQKATKGLDADVAWNALGGGTFDEKDMGRYEALMRSKARKEGKGKEEPKPDPKPDPQPKPNPKPQPQPDPRKQTIQPVGRGGRGATGKPENPIDKTTTGQTDSTPSNLQTQNVNQNNDINSTVTGDNNTVINEQDNSIRQYGGDNRSFVYKSGTGNPYEDTPVSAATMSGYYDVNDSPAAQAGRFDFWSTMNSDAQKRYAGDAMKTYAKYGKTDARSYTDESMENALNRGVQYSFDRADRQTGHVFGDIWHDDYITEEWKMPSAPEKIESNAAEIADKAKSDIEDI